MHVQRCAHWNARVVLPKMLRLITRESQRHGFFQLRPFTQIQRGCCKYRLPTAGIPYLQLLAGQLPGTSKRPASALQVPIEALTCSQNTSTLLKCHSVCCGQVKRGIRNPSRRPTTGGSEIPPSASTSTSFQTQCAKPMNLTS